MIRRDDGDDWLLISQVDHAHLAGVIASAWGNAEVPALPRSEWLVPAVRGHDDGWREWEDSPHIDPATGTPREFLEMPMVEATAIWNRSIAKCGKHPFGKLWVSRHFQHLTRLALESREDNNEDVAALEHFLEVQQAVEQDERAAGAALSFVGDKYDQLAERGFRYVQMFDRMSLWLCCAERSKPQDFAVPHFGIVQLTPQSNCSTIVGAPGPLSVDSLLLSTPARRIPARRYMSDDEYRRTLASAPVEQLQWELRNPG
ncbi:MAG: DUF3891 family protein [Planctomycetaceae bacterium]